MTKTILTTVLFLALGQIGFSQNLDKAKLDNYFNALEQNNKFMGSVAVSKNGEIIYTKSIGLADVETNLKALENTTYSIVDTILQVLHTRDSGLHSRIIDSNLLSIKCLEQVALNSRLCGQICVKYNILGYDTLPQSSLYVEHTVVGWLFQFGLVRPLVGKRPRRSGPSPRGDHDSEQVGDDGIGGVRSRADCLVQAQNRLTLTTSE